MNIFVGGNYFVYHGSIKNNHICWHNSIFGGMHTFFFPISLLLKNITQPSVLRKSAMSNVYFITKMTREQRQKLLCAKKCSLLLGYSNTLDEKLCPSFIVNGMLKILEDTAMGIDVSSLCLLMLMLCLITPGVRFDWSYKRNKSWGAENLGDNILENQILEKTSFSSQLTSTAVNEILL